MSENMTPATLTEEDIRTLMSMLMTRRTEIMRTAAEEGQTLSGKQAYAQARAELEAEFGAENIAAIHVVTGGLANKPEKRWDQLSVASAQEERKDQENDNGSASVGKRKKRTHLARYRDWCERNDHVGPNTEVAFFLGCTQANITMIHKRMCAEGWVLTKDDCGYRISDRPEKKPFIDVTQAKAEIAEIKTQLTSMNDLLNRLAALEKVLGKAQ